MIDLFIRGGPVMVPIALIALVSTVIIIERLLFFRSVVKTDRELVSGIRPLVSQGQFDKAASLCEKAGTPLARILDSGIQQRMLPEAHLKDAILNTANREVPHLEKYLPILGTFANIATLLGLLGTVTGNIRAFGVLAAGGTMGNPALLAGAIAEALITTAAGLIVSIPTVIFYNYLGGRANRHISEMESAAGDFILLVSSARDPDRKN